MQYMTALKGHKVKFIGNRKMAEMPSPVSSWSLAGQYGVRVIVTVMLSREGNDSSTFWKRYEIRFRAHYDEVSTKRLALMEICCLITVACQE